MSIIVTHINENGIVHAADSNLTDQNGMHVGTAQKVFEIPGRDAGLTVAGTYGVGADLMDVWLPQFIAADASVSLEEFAESLRSAVDQEATDTQKNSGYFFHLAGYQDGSDGIHPEFYHVTNFDMDSAGNYQVTSLDMRVSEDFWSTHGGRPLDEVFAGRFGKIYCNGFPSGRQIYFELLQRMSQLRVQVWGNPDWDFRPPKTVDEEAEVLKLDMEHVKLFFLHSDYTAPFIGGSIETLNIPSRKQDAAGNPLPVE